MAVYGNLEIVVDPNNLLYWSNVATTLAEYYGSNVMKELDEFELNVNSLATLKQDLERNIGFEKSGRAGSKATGIQFSQTVMRLTQIANTIANGGFDITPYLPITKAKNFPKNRKIEIVDSGCTCVFSQDYKSIQRLALMLRTCGTDGFTDYDTYGLQPLQPNQAILGLYTVKSFDKADPVLNIDGTVRQRTGSLSRKDLVSGVVYTGSTGGDMLYIGRAHAVSEQLGHRCDYFMYAKMTKANKELLSRCTSVSQFLQALDGRAAANNAYWGVRDELVAWESYKKMIAVAEGYPQLQPASGVIITSKWKFEFI